VFCFLFFFWAGVLKAFYKYEDVFNRHVHFLLFTEFPIMSLKWDYFSSFTWSSISVISCQPFSTRELSNHEHVKPQNWWTKVTVSKWQVMQFGQIKDICK